jgi:hypothetical protein
MAVVHLYLLPLLSVACVLNAAAVAPVPSTNYQTFAAGAGGILAPAVTFANGQWYQSGASYSSLATALQQSCYAQANACSAGTTWPASGACWGSQVNDCQTAGNSIAAAYTSSAIVQSSKVASANYAAATMVRTVPQDQQSFTHALGGAAAPAVTGSGNNWHVAGDSASYYFLANALQSSCWSQQGACEKLINAPNAGPEMNVYNCDTVQINACLQNAEKVVSGVAPDTTSLVAITTTPIVSSTKTIATVDVPTPTAKAATTLTLTTTTSASPVSTDRIPTGWSLASVGCIAEGNGGRALTGASFSDPAMTRSKCINFCVSKGFAVAGLEVSLNRVARLTISTPQNVIAVTSSRVQRAYSRHRHLAR